MGLNFNNPVDQDLTPNQASVGPNYQVQVPQGVPQTTPIVRKGVVTRVDLTGRALQTAAQVFQFAVASRWRPGDTVFIQAPSVQGGVGDILINDTQGILLCDWAPMLANGGMFVYGAGAFLPPPSTDQDFCCVLTGPSQS